MLLLQFALPVSFLYFVLSYICMMESGFKKEFVCLKFSGGTYYLSVPKFL